MYTPVQIITNILQHVQFRVPRGHERFYYTSINDRLISVSDHHISIDGWNKALAIHPEYETLPIFSLVFTDNDGDLMHYNDISTNERQINLIEYVYKAQDLNDNDIKEIIQTIKLTPNTYMDNTNKGYIQ